MVITVLEKFSFLGRDRALWNAAASSVPPPPRWASIRRIALRIFSFVAGREEGAMTWEEPAKRIRLNRSV
jgi:hypothetical protein